MKDLFTLDEAKKFLIKEEPKFLCLKDSRGDKVIGFNNPKTQNKPFADKFKRIEDVFKKQTYPDGLYFIEYTDHLLKDHAKHTISVAKGDKNKISTDVVVHTPQVITAVAENVWTPSEAVKHISDKNMAVYENKKLAEENAQLKKEIEELEKEVEKNSTLSDQPTGDNGIIKQITTLLDIAGPTIDKIFSYQDRRLSLMEKLATNGAGKPQRQAAPAKQYPEEAFREDGGIKFDSEHYEDYFAYVHDNADEDFFENEMDLLQAAHPQLYTQLCQQYNITED